MRLNYLSATDALAKLQAGQITSEALVRDCLRRIEEREPDVRAWAAIDRDGALSAARNADKVRRNAAGEMRLLLGIPVGVKDTISTADLPTVYNSPIYRDHRPGSDAAIVDLLRSAGAIALGKTETVEFAAHGRPAPTRNPCDPTRTPSGSSSGSAAAVADFMVPLAIGSQTGGSLIRPGSYCGCVGFKPTYGTVSTEGVKPFSVSLDTVGWYGRSVEDIALVARAFEIVEGALPRQRRLAAAGATVENFELGPEFAEVADLQETIMCGEGYFAFLNLFRAHPDNVSESIHRRIVRVSNSKLVAAQDKAAALRPTFDRMAERYDAILTPSAPGEAPRGPNVPVDAIFNGLWTLLHAPCITLPGLFGPQGLPLGIQLVAPRHADGSLLTAAAGVAPFL